MPDDGKKSPAEITEDHEIAAHLPEILDKVQYEYANHARLASNKWDVRIAFGEIGPTGVLTPKTGVILPHIVAKGLAAALDRIVKKVEERIGEIVDPDQPTAAVDAGEQKKKPKGQRGKASI